MNYFISDIYPETLKKPKKFAMYIQTKTFFNYSDLTIEINPSLSICVPKNYKDNDYK